jgi:hypothetical protein
MAGFFVLLFLLVPFLPQEKPALRFTEEYLEFSLDGKKFRVNGNYVFVNTGGTEIHQQIIYPFPVENSFIDSIHIFNSMTGKFLQPEAICRGVSFTIDIPPLDTVTVNIFYEQTGITDTARYILTTTKNWNSPLAVAKYSLETDPSVKVRSFSYPPDVQTERNHRIRYTWSRKDFLPDCDFIVVFDRK